MRAHQPPVRRRRTARRKPASSGTGLACFVAAVALAAVMGVTLRQEPAPQRTAAPKAPPARIVPRVVQEPQQPSVRPAHPLDVLAKTVRDAERRTPGIKQLERGPVFDKARLELVSQVAEARDELGTWLDAHPSDDRANRLWDRVLRLFVALRKI